jgi:CRISPR-associated endonuclease/helicase Cas3
MLLAHSAKPKKGILEQSYAAHVGGVVSRAVKAAEEASKYSVLNKELLNVVVRRAAEYHDLGKLDDENQEVLSGKRHAAHLPVQHTDAGTAFLKENGSALDAVLVRSHHIGLPDWPDEENRGEQFFRDKDQLTRQKVDESLKALLACHNDSITGLSKLPTVVKSWEGTPSIFLRIALSCLADGDHTDTGIHYKDYPAEEKHFDLKPLERLAALDAYVTGLGNTDDERSRLRKEMYYACRNSDVSKNSGIASCDSPVGSGKTTAVMAHLLMQAKYRNLRRIIVVLPFTNIITQSVETYRKSLVLPDENPEDVVAELHHRADFKDIESRHLTALWNAPIIVTTAVTFFETLASNTTSTLRRLHKLPGSAIFVDESHAALPAKLLPIAWDWIKSYGVEWGCYWVLASGSLNRFWQIPEFDKEPPQIPEIVQESLRVQLSAYEINRVSYQYIEKPKTADELIDWVSELPGPRIVILNTVQSAAAVASLYAKKFGRDKVEHLSTALTPKDRDATLKRIKNRLANAQFEANGNWTLIATSCVEAGVDLSFRTGVRELGSLVSLLQIAGRVNRHGGLDSQIWTIRLAELLPLKIHPGIKEAAQVLQGFFNSNITISPDLCTEALKREVRLVGTDLKKLRQNELEKRFPLVEKEFRVITGDTYTVIIDHLIVEKLENYEKTDWIEIQKGSVHIWGYKLGALHIPEINGKPGMYKWNLAYNDFIGYMAGVLQVEAFTNNIDGACII